MARYYNDHFNNSDVARLIRIASEPEFLAVHVIDFSDEPEILFFRIIKGDDAAEAITEAVNDHIRSNNKPDVVLILDIPVQQRRERLIWIPASKKHLEDRVMRYLEDG